MKKIVISALALFVILFSGALSEEMYIPTAEGGVIYRETAVYYRTRALISELNVAYLDVDSPYLTKGVQTKFTVHATGGDGRYTYNFTIWHRTGRSGGLSYVASSGDTTSSSWFYTPNKDDGQYMLTIKLKDSAGSFIEWQSKVYETSTHASVQKAVSLAQECKKAATGDYARALWLHDWLIMNANYDYTYTYYYPEGVLLYGAGVCQSYALAYEMLLKLVDIECLYVTGEAGGESHGWNLVKIDGEWYHVDCTWDDPGTGGNEHHRYFCVPDEVIERDHKWRPTEAQNAVQIMPEATDRNRMYMIRSGADICKTVEDVIAILNEAVDARRGYAEIWYTGDADSFDFDAAFNKWYAQTGSRQVFTNCRYWAEDTDLQVEFDYGSGWPDRSVPVTMVIESEDGDMERGGSQSLLVLTVPSTADKSNLIWTSSDSSVVSVKNGLATAVNPGVCTITASHPGGAKAEIVMYVRSGSHLTIPSIVDTIEEEAFCDCALLEVVLIEPGVTEIKSRAFMNARLLLSVTIPDSVTRMGEDIFKGCERVVIQCSEGSCAHEYALKEGVEFRLLSK
ncbi:MAG: leucine-rich repeat protein [Clostridia bacterium]|nr:leucine-rich repeat protein [Clostridia bacterium]